MRADQRNSTRTARGESADQQKGKKKVELVDCGINVTEPAQGSTVIPAIKGESHNEEEKGKERKGKERKGKDGGPQGLNPPPPPPPRRPRNPRTYTP